MPIEDKTELTEPTSAAPSAQAPDTVSGTQSRTPLTSATPEPPAQPPPEKQPRLVAADPDDGSATGNPADSDDKTLTQDGRAEGTAPPPGDADSEDITQLQDDLSKKEAQRRSLASLDPKVAGYKILEKIGQGTYGVVWRARELKTGIEVAIKFFAHGTGEQWQTLQAEVKQLAMLSSDPGIIQLIDVEPDALPPYFIMNFAEQGSLAKRLEKGPLSLEESVEIFRRVVEALAYVHAKGIRHCDLKPGNILLDARGRPKVADFGQAHLSNDASPALGTFFYMAPEQADLNKQIPDTRWDVYGLGALMYAMVTGRPPREDSTLRTQLAGTEKLAHRLERYRAAVAQASDATKHRKVKGMDRGLADIISRCLEVDPDKRFHDANAILEALKRRDWNRHQRPLLIFGLVAPVLVLFMLALIAWSQGSAAISEFRASQERQVSEDCKTAARLIQSVIRNKLLEQADRVKRMAENEKAREALGHHQALFRKEAALLRQSILAGAPRDVAPDELQYAANLHKLRTDLEYLGRNGFDSWALVDRKGDSVVGDVFGEGFEPRHKEAGETEAAYVQRRKELRHGQEVNFGTDFSWRKYFNGQTDFYEKNGVEPPRRTPCAWPEHPDPNGPKVLVTDPYLNKRKTGGLSIGVSAPVYVEGPGGVKTLAGVFLGNISVKELHQWLAETEIKDGFAVILDSQQHCLFHTGEFDADGKANQIVIEAVRPKDTRTLPKFDFGLAERSIQGHGSGIVFDPVVEQVLDKRTKFIGGWVPIVGTKDGVRSDEQMFEWTALVEQDYAAVMRPVETIAWQMASWGLIKLGVACLLLLAMWAWLLKKLVREERVVHA